MTSPNRPAGDSEGGKGAKSPRRPRGETRLKRFVHRNLTGSHLRGLAKKQPSSGNSFLLEGPGKPDSARRASCERGDAKNESDRLRPRESQHSFPFSLFRPSPLHITVLALPSATSFSLRRSPHVRHPPRPQFARHCCDERRRIARRLGANLGRRRHLVSAREGLAHDHGITDYSDASALPEHGASPREGHAALEGEEPTNSGRTPKNW